MASVKKIKNFHPEIEVLKNSIRLDLVYFKRKLKVSIIEKSGYEELFYLENRINQLEHYLQCFNNKMYHCICSIVVLR